MPRFSDINLAAPALVNRAAGRAHTKEYPFAPAMVSQEEVRTGAADSGCGGSTT
jgi:hypothetical protein